MKHTANEQKQRTAPKAPVKSPLDDGRGPRQPPAKHHHQDLIPLLEATGAVGLVEGDGNGGGGGVAVAVEIDHEAVHGDIEPAGDGLDDAEVGLVRDEAGNFGGRHAGVDEDLLGGLDHGGHGVLVGLAAVHADGDGVLGRGGASGRMCAATAGDVEDVGESAVASHAGGHDAARSLAMAQDGCSGAVTEENAGIAVLPVDDGGKLVGSDDQNGLRRSRGDVVAGSLHSEKESGAGSRKIETGGVHGTDPGLHEAGGAGEEHVGRDRGADDQVDLLGLHAGILHGGQGGTRGHLAGHHLGTRDAALLDAGARLDPLVAGIDQLLKIGIGHHPVRSVAAGPDDGSGAQGLRRHR